MIYDSARAEQLEVYEERFGEEHAPFVARDRRKLASENKRRRSSRRAGYVIYKRTAPDACVPLSEVRNPVTRERSRAQMTDLLQEIGEAVLHRGDSVTRLKLEIPAPRPLLPSTVDEPLS